MLSKSYWRIVVALSGLLLGLTGCNALESGLRDGLQKASSAAVVELIKAPVAQLIRAWFPDA